MRVINNAPSFSPRYDEFKVVEHIEAIRRKEGTVVSFFDGTTIEEVLEDKCIKKVLVNGIPYSTYAEAWVVLKDTPLLKKYWRLV